MDPRVFEPPDRHWDMMAAQTEGGVDGVRASIGGVGAEEEDIEKRPRGVDATTTIPPALYLLLYSLASNDYVPLDP